MAWTVTFSRQARKQADKLPFKVQERLYALRLAMGHAGPIQPAMPNFGRLKNWPGEVYHCHLNKGRPRYVVCWQVDGNELQVIEVFYVGTHEKAPY